MTDARPAMGIRIGSPQLLITNVRGVDSLFVNRQPAPAVATCTGAAAAIDTEWAEFLPCQDLRYRLHKTLQPLLSLFTGRDASAFCRKSRGILPPGSLPNAASVSPHMDQPDGDGCNGLDSIYIWSSRPNNQSRYFPASRNQNSSSSEKQDAGRHPPEQASMPCNHARYTFRQERDTATFSPGSQQ